MKYTSRNVRQWPRRSVADTVGVVPRFGRPYLRDEVLAHTYVLETSGRLISDAVVLWGKRE